MHEYREMFDEDENPLPQMPFLQNLILVNPKTGKREDGHEAIVDTGADHTCLPQVIIDRLVLPEHGPFWWMLRIEQEKEGLVFPRVLVRPAPPQFAHEFILGREILNQFHMLLRPTEGTRGELDIIIPSLKQPA